ncbi:hypothetical protein Q1695_009134 [Nippostrongylus brasiliensis]|nr:hypothetical protein Q1695_009134 [Nippostrongylus brasiliensis]
MAAGPAQRLSATTCVRRRTTTLRTIFGIHRQNLTKRETKASKMKDFTTRTDPPSTNFYEIAYLVLQQRCLRVVRQCRRSVASEGRHILEYIAEDHWQIHSCCQINPSSTTTLASERSYNFK